MTKQEITDKLTSNHRTFADLIVSLNDRDFLHALPGKWTAGQQLDHILRAVSPLTKILALPKFMIKLIFGKANRPSKDYENLVKKYHAKLESGGKATGRFIPSLVEPVQKEILKNKLLRAVARLIKNTDDYSEQQLDAYILPHPLLGKLTLREMFYFTIYHVEHHQKATLRNLGR
ncbi:MAG: DinB family protein [Candidatus Paceibacterales bacterium]